MVTVPAVFSNGTWVHVAASIDENGQLWLCKNGEVQAADKEQPQPPALAGAVRPSWAAPPPARCFWDTSAGRASGRPPRPPRQVSETRLQRLGGTTRAFPPAVPCKPRAAWPHWMPLPSVATASSMAAVPRLGWQPTAAPFQHAPGGRAARTRARSRSMEPAPTRACQHDR